MSDPFLPVNSKNQLIREAKIGFSLVLVVVATLGYWGWVQYQNVRRSIPDHVRRAPVARHVGPDEYLSHLTEQFPTGGSRSNPTETEAAPSQPIANRVGVDPNRQIKDPNSRPEPQPINSEILLGSINDNIEQLNEIANSFVAPRKTASKSPKPATPLFAGLNPNSTTAAEDLSRRLEPWDKSISKDPVEELDSKASDNSQIRDPQFADSNQLPAMMSRPDSMVQPASFDEENVSQESPGPPIELSTRPVEQNVQQSDDEQIHLQVVDPPRGQISAHPTTFTRPGAARPGSAEDLGDIFDGHYRTQSGDTWWSIAQEKYGDGGYFRALFECNREKIEDFESLTAGLAISTPTIAALQERFPELCPAKVDAEVNSEQIYKTQAGDTLFSIARQTMGQASRYLELLHLNRDRLAPATNHLTRLPANLELRLPLR